MTRLKTTMLLCICLLLSCAKKTALPSDIGKQSKMDVHFVTDVLLSDIVDMAKRQEKVVFMYVHADWCLPCQMMEEEVFSHKPTYEFLNENFVPYKVDAEKRNGPDLKALFGIEELPGLLFLDHRGRVLEQKQGMAFHTELREMAITALEKGSLALMD